MSFWTAVVVMTAIIAFASMRIARYRAGLDDPRPRTHFPAGPVSEEQSRHEIELEDELKQLRERVKVLERIATDANSSDGRRSRAIAEEIEELRDR